MLNCVILCYLRGVRSNHLFIHVIQIFAICLCYKYSLTDWRNKTVRLTHDSYCVELHYEEEYELSNPKHCSMN